MSGRIASEFVGDQFPWNFSLILQHSSKEPLSGPLVPLFRHQDVEGVAVLIDSTPKIEPLSSNFHEQLIHMPDFAQSPLSLSEPSSVFRSELQTPESDGFMRNHDATFGQQVLHISKAERESVVEPDSVADNLARKSVASVAGLHTSIVNNHADHSST